MRAPSPADTVRAAARTIGPNTSTLPGSRVKVSPAMPMAPTARPSASSTVARLLRSSLIDVLSSDHIRSARAKGFGPLQVVLRHGLRNASLPVVTVVGLEVGNLLGGAILTERVFSWPGVGQLTVEAISNRDFPLVQATVLFFAATFVVVNLLVDLSYSFLDPRVRTS